MSSKYNISQSSGSSLAIHSHWHGEPEFGCRLRIDDVSYHLTGYLPHTFEYFLRSIIILMYHIPQFGNSTKDSTYTLGLQY